MHRPALPLLARALHGFILLLCLAALAAPLSGRAQPDSIDATLDAARRQLDGIQKSLNDETPDARLVELRTSALELQTRADALGGELAPQFANVEARVAELGDAPASGEAADVASQRAVLGKQRNQLDAQLKLARLLAVESAQAADRISELRRSRFQARLFERTASVLAPPFWQELATNAPLDLQRLRDLAAQVRDASSATPLGVWVGLLLAACGVLALHGWARNALLRVTATRVPAGRLRRSALATANTVLPTLVGVAVAQLLVLGPGWSAPLPPALQSLLGYVVGATALGTYIASLGYALLSPRRPSWRLPSLPDLHAARMRRYPLVLGGAVGLGFLVERIAAIVNASLATAVAVNGLIAFALGLLVARVLRRGHHVRREVHGLPKDQAGDKPAGDAPQGEAAAATALPPRPLWASVLSGAGWLLVMLSLVCVLAGYVALGSFIVKQVAWIATVLASAYLLGTLIDDAFMALLAAPASAAEAEHEEAGDPPGRLRAQAAVLLSGAARVFVALMALVLILAPFGQGPSELLTRAGTVSQGVALGEIQVRPGLVLQALLVLVGGLIAVRLLQRWLADSYLPTTRIDPGMRSSATTLLGYVGVIVAVSLAMSAVGLGLERIAWVASALSVGIGFGLQAVVSNFVSGLILLAERPVKVGDWVSLGGVEGDIRRINVRATEIQMGDRSTVIVPNSEFITKTVRNLTLANPLGLVSFKLPMPLDTDVEKVRELLLAAFDAHEDVLKTPAPSVFLDGIDAANLVFNASGSVSSPRKAYGVKSALLFDILRRLREAHLALGRPPTMLLQAAAPPDTTPSLLPTSGARTEDGAGIGSTRS